MPENDEGIDFDELTLEPVLTRKASRGRKRRDERPYDNIKAFVVSDVHLNNHPYDRETESENPRRRNFRLFLTRLNTEIHDTGKMLLVLNGDILDVNGSWFEPVMPWDSDAAKVEETLNRLLVDIMENNLSTIEELRQLLKHPLSEIIYIFGNHDGLLQKFPSSHQVIRNFLTADPNEQGRIRFADHFTSEELDIHIEHGHQLDPFNRAADTAEPPLGDIINILIINRFVELAIARLRESGYSEAFIVKMHSRLHDIEYLRPLSLLPVWVQTIANQYHSHPENVGKLQSVRDILIDTISHILLDPKMTQLMTERLHMPRRFLIFLIRLTLRIPAILPMISFVTSKVAQKGHSNKYQYQAAQRIYQEKGYRLVVFGHTHIPGVLPLSESAYYFNTGSWKPVINLFKHSKDPVELEYLNPDVQFNKVERSGILRIEKSDFTGRTPTEFALQTIQSGLG
jgi:UDP-2,3-diacylglucosamine pyrophosphatase LpxH